MDCTHANWNVIVHCTHDCILYSEILGHYREQTANVLFQSALHNSEPSEGACRCVCGQTEDCCYHWNTLHSHDGTLELASNE